MSENESMNKPTKWLSKKTLIVAALIIVVPSLLIAAGFIIYKSSDKIQVLFKQEVEAPHDCEDYVGEDYEDVIEEFVDAGFTNIKLKFTGNLTSWINIDEDQVISVEIDHDEFERDDTFDPEDQVLIEVYNFGVGSSTEKVDIDDYM